jgi:hypothetical protein
MLLTSPLWDHKMNASRMLVCLLLVLGCQSLLAQAPSTKSDREKAGLIGPVAKIKVESTYFKFQNDKFVESERELREESEYDKLGKLVNQKKIPMYGDPATCHYHYKYDDKHRETQRFCMEGTRERILEKYAYEDDRFGNWIKRQAAVFDTDGFRAQWTLYRTITYFD